jgi:hypothetical protein
MYFLKNERGICPAFLLALDLQKGSNDVDAHSYDF